MNTFATAVKQNLYSTPARTENGMLAHANTSSAVLDFFSQVGSARGKDMSGSFLKALGENQDLALRALLWLRDIRGGAGEREQFRKILAKLDSVNPVISRSIMAKVPELGRWDDLFAYTDPLNRKAAFSMIKAALDAKNGLVAKWLPRKGALAVELTRFLGLTPKGYRTLIVGLTKVVETQMAAKNWNEINFSHVPSRASKLYQKAFGRNAPESYSAYINELKKPIEQRDPSVKVNAGTLYPYEVIRALNQGNTAVADSMWEALPNYVGNKHIFPLIDTSGSMGYLHSAGGKGNPSPIEISVSLGHYLASKNTSVFKDMYMIFDTKPKLVNATGSLSSRVRSTPRIDGMNTDLEAAFRMLLDVAIRGKVKSVDMPDAILIVSDMQFDKPSGWGHKGPVTWDITAQQMITEMYSRAGYNMPKVIYWNVGQALDKNTPVKFDSLGTAIVSGYSPSILESVLSLDLEVYSPYNVMLKTLMKDRYAFN